MKKVLNKFLFLSITLFLIITLLIGEAVSERLFAAPQCNTLGTEEGCSNKGCVASIKTRYSKVSLITTAESTFRLLVNNKYVDTLEGNSVYIQGKFSIGESDIVLIALYSGGMACPMSLYIVEVRNASTYIVSPSFGTCTDSYEAYIDKDSLIIRMPFYFNPLHLDELSESKRKEIENRKDVIYRWFNSELHKFGLWIK